MADLDTKPAEGAAADAESAVERDPELAKKKELFNAVVSSFGYRWGRHGFHDPALGARLISRAPAPRPCPARPGRVSQQRGRQRVP